MESENSVIAAQPEHEDSELVRAVLAGDRGAFDVLVERYFAMIYLIGYARLANRESAEDLAQEVFLRAFLGLRSLENPRYFAGWLSQIARHLATDWVRRDQRASPLIRAVPIDDLGDAIADERTKGACEIVEANDRHRVVQKAIMDLPPDQRELVLLHYIGGLSKSEIARRAAIHPSTVRRQLDKALAAMKTALEPALRELAPIMGARGGATRRTIAIIAAVSALSAAKQSALAEAAAATLQLSSVPTTASGSISGVGALLGSLKAVLAATAKGGGIMGIKAKTAAAAAALALVSGGTYYYVQQAQRPSQHVAPVQTGGTAAAGPQLKAVSLDEVFAGKDVSFERGGYKDAPLGRIYGSSMKQEKPATITKEPRASGLPLYGTLSLGAKKEVVFRLDQSGSNVGHDRLIIDLNGNDDLTDDRVYKCRDEMGMRDWKPRMGAPFERVVFGPIEVPTDKAGGQWRPIYRAEAYVSYRLSDGALGGGQLWWDNLNYLETTIEVDGVRETIWVADANCNQRFGDRPAAVGGVRKSLTGLSWVFGEGGWDTLRGDLLVRVRADSGMAGTDRPLRESEPLGPVTYFGGKPYVLSVAEDLSGVRVEPYQDAVGALIVPNCFSGLSFVWQNAAGEWGQLGLVPSGGPIPFPVGTYYLLSGGITGRDKDGNTVRAMISMWQQKPGNPIVVEAGKTTTLPYGPPLIVEAVDNTITYRPTVRGIVRDALETAARGNAPAPSPSRPFVFGTKITGAGGEHYELLGFRRSGKERDSEIFARFRVFDETGAEVGRTEEKAPPPQPGLLRFSAEWWAPKHLIGRKVRVVPEIDLGDLEMVAKPLELQL